MEHIIVSENGTTVTIELGEKATDRLDALKDAAKVLGREIIRYEHYINRHLDR